MFRKQTTRLNAFISAAPAQGGKTMAQFSAELLSAQIPLFPGSTNAQYSDNPAQLFFDSGKSMDEVVAFYRQTLASAGWKPTMDKLTQVSIYDVMIFRNPAGDMMELQLHDFEGQEGGLLRYSTAEEVARLDALAKQEAEEQRKRRSRHSKWNNWPSRFPPRQSKSRSRANPLTSRWRPAGARHR